MSEEERERLKRKRERDRKRKYILRNMSDKERKERKEKKEKKKKKKKKKKERTVITDEKEREKALQALHSNVYIIRSSDSSTFTREFGNLENFSIFTQNCPFLVTFIGE